MTISFHQQRWTKLCWSVAQRRRLASTQDASWVPASMFAIWRASAAAFCVAAACTASTSASRTAVSGLGCGRACRRTRTSGARLLTSTTRPPSAETTKDGLFTLKEVECLGACADSPVMLVNDRTMCSFMSPEKLDQLVDALRAAEAP